MKTPATASEPVICEGNERSGFEIPASALPDSASVGKEPKRVGPPSLLADEIAREKAAATPSGGGEWTVETLEAIWDDLGYDPHNCTRFLERVADAHNQSLSETGRGEQPRDCGEDESQKAHELLDKLGAPRNDESGIIFSLSGRINRIPRDYGEVFKLLAEIRDLMPEWSMKDLRDRIDAAMKSQTGKP